MIVCVIGLISTIVVAKILGYNVGQASGLAAGSLTQSAVIEVAQDSISNLNLTDVDKKAMMDFVPVGYAVTYIFGTIGCAFILATFGPKLLGVDLEEKSKKLDNSSKDSLEGKLMDSRAGDVDYRAYIINDKYVGQSVKNIENQLAADNIHLFLIRIKRDGKLFRPTENEIIQKMITLLFLLKNVMLKKLIS